MEQIIEIFSKGFYAVIGGCAVFLMITPMIHPGGVIYTAVSNFITAICG
jgi:hypothetical protein